MNVNTDNRTFQGEYNIQYKRDTTQNNTKDTSNTISKENNKEITEIPKAELIKQQIEDNIYKINLDKISNKIAENLLF